MNDRRLRLRESESSDLANRKPRSTLSGTGLYWGLVVPLLIASGISLFVSVRSMYVRLTLPYPQNPWESAIIVDAVRAARGMPVYESMESGHAAHMYGPMTSYLLGSIFRFTGPNLVAGRWISLISAVLLVVTVVIIFAKKQLVLSMIALALMVALHYRCRAYFTETRPDTVALLLAAWALLAAYLAAQTTPPWLYLLAGLLVVLAAGFKQTYAVAALVPPCAVLLTDWNRRRRDRGISFILSLIPLACVGAALLSLRIFWPHAYFYSITAPSRYSVPLPRVWTGVMGILSLSPLFIALLFVGRLRRGFDPMRRPGAAWILTAVVLGSAAGVIAFAKRGGSYNSMMLGFAPMTLFCIVTMRPVLRWLDDPRNSLLSRTGVSVFLALLLATTTLAVPMSDRWAGTEGHGTDLYSKAIRICARMEGTVACPDDPTITLFARGRIERSLDAELDATGRTGFMPMYVARDLRQADWIIWVHTNFSSFNNETALPDLGFERANDRNIGRGYSVWKRVVPSDAPLPHEISLIVRRPVFRDQP